MALNPRSAALALLATVLGTGASAAAAPDEPIVWRGRSYALEELPAEVGAAARDALGAWEPWAREHGYRLSLSDDGRLLFGASQKRRTRKDEALLEKTLAAFDALVPKAPPAPAPTAGPDVPREDEPRASSGVDAGASWTWGERPAALESETAALFAFEGAEDLASAAAWLGGRHEFLRAWAASIGGQSGFLLERPLCAGYLLAGDGLEEYSPENELVHRATQLLTLRRVGRQPAWLQLGLAWYAESELTGGIWCFPGRDDFVGRGEHTDWDRTLRSLYKKADPPTVEQVAALRRGAWGAEAALHAWGAVAYLARFEPEALPRLARTFHEARVARSRVTHEDGTWEWIPDLELDPATQAEILREQLGPGFLDELGTFFRKGKAYRRG